MGTAPEDDYLVHFDPQDKRLARMMMDSHKLVGWCLIATGALIAYEQIIMNTLGDILWRWGQKAPVWRAIDVYKRQGQARPCRPPERAVEPELQLCHP